MIRQVEVGYSCLCLTDTAAYKMMKPMRVVVLTESDIREYENELIAMRQEGDAFLKQREIKNTRCAKNGRRIVQEEEAKKRLSSSVIKVTAPVSSPLSQRRHVPRAVPSKV